MREDEWQPAGGSERCQPFAVGDDGTRSRVEGHSVVLGKDHECRPSEVRSIRLRPKLDAVLLNRHRKVGPPEDFENVELGSASTGIESDAALCKQTADDRHVAAGAGF